MTILLLASLEEEVSDAIDIPDDDTLLYDYSQSYRGHVFHLDADAVATARTAAVLWLWTAVVAVVVLVVLTVTCGIGLVQGHGSYLWDSPGRISSLLEPVWDTFQFLLDVTSRCYSLLADRLFQRMQRQRAFTDTMPELEELSEDTQPPPHPEANERSYILRRDPNDLEPAFRTDSEYPPGWMVYHPVLGVVLKETADAYPAQVPSRSSQTHATEEPHASEETRNGSLVSTRTGADGRSYGG